MANICGFWRASHISRNFLLNFSLTFLQLQTISLASSISLSRTEINLECRHQPPTPSTKTIPTHHHYPSPSLVIISSFLFLGLILVVETTINGTDNYTINVVATKSRYQQPTNVALLSSSLSQKIPKSPPRILFDSRLG
ncbi:unnamed protein product [Lactuca saligna]|uniref:Transmembrane protein n=1 Tax=Lactuca saligna TaxID=75948 RepID=A0AA36EG05_LACSI|nr:unnamed protein product [Lactuca saligna]